MGTGSFLNLWAVQMRWEFKQEREKVTYSLIRMISCNVCRCCPYRDFSLKESQTDDQHCLGMSFPWDLKSHTSPILYPPLGFVPNRFHLSQKTEICKITTFRKVWMDWNKGTRTPNVFLMLTVSLWCPNDPPTGSRLDSRNLSKLHFVQLATLLKSLF